MRVGVLEGPGLARLFRRLEGRRLLVVVDTGDGLELVFDDDAPGPNLLSIYYDAARLTGLAELGGVMDAAEYAREWRRFVGLPSGSA